MKTKECQFCDSELDKNSLNAHIASFHRIAKKQHKCGICEKVFKTRQEFKRHFNAIHNNDVKLFSCNICKKSFQTQINLNSHIKDVHDHGCQ